MDDHLITRLIAAVRGWLAGLPPRPVEAAAIARELIAVANRNRVNVRSEGTYVPCRYLVALPPTQLEHLDRIGARALVERSVVKTLQEHINQKQLRLNGPLEVRLTSAEGIEPGTIGIEFSFSPPGSEPSQDSEAQTEVIRLSAAQAAAYLEVLNGPQQGCRFDLYRLPAVIGRSKQASGLAVGLQDDPQHQGVSRHHARIERRGDQWHLVDTRSSNGTWLNGQRLEPDTPYTLVEGDTIDLAKQVSLRFHLIDEGKTIVRKAR